MTMCNKYVPRMLSAGQCEQGDVRLVPAVEQRMTKEKLRW